MKMLNFELASVVTAMMLVTCSSNYCRPKELKTCLQPLLAHVVEENNKASSGYKNFHHKLMEVSIGHYFNTLEDLHENTVHIDSLDHVLMPLDGMMFSDLTDTCRVFKTSTECLASFEEWCDQEARDVLDGFENVFKYLCDDQHQQVFRNNSKCLLENSNSSRICEQVFNKTISTMVRTLNRREEARLDFYNYTISMHPTNDSSRNLIKYLHTFAQYIKNHTGTDPFQHMSMINPSNVSTDLQRSFNTTISEVCQAVAQALLCDHSEMYTACGKDAALWQSQLRLSLVDMLLIDLRCENLDDWIKPSENKCFNCTSTHTCIGMDRVCNGHVDCADGEDESNDICSASATFSTSHVLYILFGIALGAVVLISVICCIAKCKESHGSDTSSTIDDGASLDIIEDEEDMGLSTPPGDKYAANSYGLQTITYNALEV